MVASGRKNKKTHELKQRSREKLSHGNDRAWSKMPYIPVAEGPRDASRPKFPKSPVSFIAEYILMYLLWLQFPSEAGALLDVTFGSVSSSKTGTKNHHIK